MCSNYILYVFVYYIIIFYCKLKIFFLIIFFSRPNSTSWVWRDSTQSLEGSSTSADGSFARDEMKQSCLRRTRMQSTPSPSRSKRRFGRCAKKRKHASKSAYGTPTKSASPPSSSPTTRMIRGTYSLAGIQYVVIFKYSRVI